MKNSVHLSGYGIFAQVVVSLSAALCLCRAQAAEWHVYAEAQGGVSGPQQIVNAVNQSASGDTIVVHPGTYDFTSVSMASGAGGVVDHLSISKALNIRGETTEHWADDVVFTGSGRAINLTADVAFKVSGITFQGFNGGTDKGGAVVFNSGWVAGNATHGDGTYMSNCVVRTCRAKIAGGVVNGLAVDCLFESNTASGYTGAAQGTRVVGCTFRGNSTLGNGCYYGALENPRGAYDCLFEGNKTYYYSGALSINNNAAGTVVSNCTFRGNSTGQNIGTVGIENATTYAPTFIDCTFEANTAQEGSAIGVRRSHATVPVIGCRFLCNTNVSTYVARGSTLFFDPLNDSKVYTWRSRYQVVDCVFEGNYSPCVGGVAAAGAFTNCTFVANGSDVHNKLAGASFYVGDCDVLDLKGCVFRDHKYYVYNWGGAIGVASNGTCHVDDCLFATNAYTYGAAIYVASHGTCRVENSVFRTNTCTSVGGAVYVEPQATTAFSNCWFEANVCSQGAAVNGGEYVDCTFTNNAAKYGVAYGAEVRDSRFTGNYLDSNGTCCDAECCQLIRCDLDGGAICLCSLDSCRIHHVSLDRSKVHSAFFNANWATNCLIDHCYGDWGIIYSSRGSRSADTDSTRPEWVNCTFADNCFWQWYSFYCHDGGKTQLALFENCIFSNNRNQNNTEHAWSDKGRVCDFNLYENMDPAGTTLRNCLWGQMFADSHCVTNFTDGGGNLANADPQFARGEKGLDEYALTLRSPARDAGYAQDWQMSATDFVGKARLFGDRVDIGCYECDLLPRGTTLIIR